MSIPVSCLNLNCMSPQECSAIKVLAFGNIIIHCQPNEEDSKTVKLNDWDKNTPENVDTNIYDIGAKENVELAPSFELGGSAWRISEILKQLGLEVLFFSACSDYKESEMIAELLKSTEMDTSHLRIQTVVDGPTGRRISLCPNDSRALYSCNGAEAQFSVNFLQFVLNEESNTVLRPPNRVQIFYVEGFFVPKREPVTTYIVRNFIQGRRYLALNLSADYIVQKHFYDLLYLVNNALFVFGKKSEFQVFCRYWGADSIKNLAEGLIKDKKTPKIFVVTKGAEGVELISNYWKDGCAPGPLTFQSFNVSPVGNTKHSGDAFVAGFLHGWLGKRQLSQCVRLGCYCANKDIKPGSRFSAMPSME